MAKSSLHVVTPRKSQPEPLDAKEIAREALEVCQQCREALRAFQAEEEMLLAHVYGLLHPLEAAAIRTLAAIARRRS